MVVHSIRACTWGETACCTAILYCQPFSNTTAMHKATKLDCVLEQAACHDTAAPSTQSNNSANNQPVKLSAREFVIKSIMSTTRVSLQRLRSSDQQRHHPMRLSQGGRSWADHQHPGGANDTWQPPIAGRAPLPGGSWRAVLQQPPKHVPCTAFVHATAHPVCGCVVCSTAPFTCKCDVQAMLGATCSQQVDGNFSPPSCLHSSKLLLSLTSSMDWV
ncbi:hypothetical protein COO60DRAFT_24145 [Scenedesmus sp. NREL 46B-D3]|nr:hypothetical protein COO60DRAFT_24145 [Scenedesmus sp. NREL 46B-D3]